MSKEEGSLMKMVCCFSGPTGYKTELKPITSPSGITGNLAFSSPILVTNYDYIGTVEDEYSLIIVSHVNL